MKKLKQEKLNIFKLEKQVENPFDKVVRILINLEDEEIDALSKCDVFNYAKELKKEFSLMYGTEYQK